jgi:hypothetical protein
MLTEVAQQGRVTDTVNGIQQKVDALIQQIEYLNVSPRKRAQENALANILAISDGARRNPSTAK